MKLQLLPHSQIHQFCTLFDCSYEYTSGHSIVYRLIYEFSLQRNKAHFIRLRYDLNFQQLDTQLFFFCKKTLDFNHFPLSFFLVRSSVGVELWHTAGANNVYTTNDKFARDESKFCRAIEFSPDGRYLAWANGSKYVAVSIFRF